MSSIADLYYLSLVEAPRRQLILTSPDFHEIFTRVMRDKVVGGIEIVHLPLPPDMQEKVRELQKAAGNELIPVLDENEESSLTEPFT